MKLEAFQTLVEVLRAGSFAAAAQTMHLTPSAVSMQMKQLEQYLGRALFDRSGQQIRATAAAGEVAAVMRPALDALQALRHRSSPRVEGSLQIGMIEMLQPLLLPPAMRELRERHPGLRIAPRRGSSQELVEAVRAGTLDAAVVALPSERRPAGLDCQTLTQAELVFVAPPDLDLRPFSRLERAAEGQRAQRGTLSARAPGAEGLDVARGLAHSLDWIRYSRNAVTGQLATRFVRQLVPGKRSLMELDSANAILGMVSAGLGFSVLQVLNRALLYQYPVQVLSLGENSPRFDVCTVHRTADVNDRLHAAWNNAVLSGIAAVGLQRSA